MDYRKELIELGLWSEDDLRDPSEEIAAAFELQEKLEAAGWSMRLGRVDGGWSCYLHHRDTWAEIISGVQPTASLAIARAALQKEKLLASSELSLIKARNEQRRTRKARTTAGPYRTSKARVYTADGSLVADMNVPTTNPANAENNAAFLTHAHNDDVEADVDRLVAEIEQLKRLTGGKSERNQLRNGVPYL